jgi:hypothetical protein
LHLHAGWAAPCGQAFWVHPVDHSAAALRLDSALLVSWDCALFHMPAALPCCCRGGHISMDVFHSSGLVSPQRGTPSFLQLALAGLLGSALWLSFECALFPYMHAALLCC